jgi:hypothetical protein
MVRGAYTNYVLMLHARQIYLSVVQLVTEQRIWLQGNHLEM